MALLVAMGVAEAASQCSSSTARQPYLSNCCVNQRTAAGAQSSTAVAALRPLLPASMHSNSFGCNPATRQLMAAPFCMLARCHPLSIVFCVAKYCFSFRLFGSKVYTAACITTCCTKSACKQSAARHSKSGNHEVAASSPGFCLHLIVLFGPGFCHFLIHGRTCEG